MNTQAEHTPLVRYLHSCRCLKTRLRGGGRQSSAERRKQKGAARPALDPPKEGDTGNGRRAQPSSKTKKLLSIGTSTAAVQALAGTSEDQALSKKRGAEPALQGSLAERLEFLVGQVSFHDLAFRAYNIVCCLLQTIPSV